MHNYNYHEWPTRPLWYFYVSTEKSQQVTDLNVFHTGGGYHIVRKAGRKGRFAKEQRKRFRFLWAFMYITRWWFQWFFMFTPKGKFSNLTNIFQLGWNHPLDPSWSYLILCSKVRTFMKMVQANVPVMVKYKSRTQPESEVSMAVCRCAWDNFTL